MRFDIDTAILIGHHLQTQDLVNAMVDPDIIEIEEPHERHVPGELLEAHLLMMQDAGWLDGVSMFNASGTWQARVTYQGHLWLEAADDQGIRQRIAEAASTHGIPAAKAVIAEGIRVFVSAALKT